MARDAGIEGIWVLLWEEVFRGPRAGKDRDTGMKGHRGKPERDQEFYCINLELFLLLIKIIDGEFGDRNAREITSRSKRISETRSLNFTDL